MKSGADDYLVKPFSLPELEARLQVLIRRSSGGMVHLVNGPLKLDPATKQVSMDGNRIDFSIREFTLLEALMKRVGEVVIKAQLTQQISEWNREIGASQIAVWSAKAMISCKKILYQPSIIYKADWRTIPGSRNFGATSLLFKISLLCYLLFSVVQVQAGVTEPEPRFEDELDFMNVLAKKGLHDLKDERWNAYGQFTYISSWKGGFPALYTNLNGSTNSLLPGSERSFTGTATLYLGLKTWHGGEIYFVPEMISMRPLSDLKGLGGVIQNFELQKGGSETPIYYQSRLFFKQTFGFGGDRIQLTSEPMQLGTTVDSRRLVVRFGNFSVIDFFDKNSYSGDLRRQFLNMAFMTYAAFDFAADARGYTWGGVAEYFYDDWTIRFAQAATSIDPNQLPLDMKVFKYYGQQVEVERRHLLYGRSGAVRVLAYRNHENMGKFSDAIAAFRADPNKNATTCTGFNYGSGNARAPDLCWARKPNDKMGIGINVEQQVLDGVGLFFRGMYSDGKTEVYSYTSTDRSISLGTLVNGFHWGRDKDLLGVGFAAGWISSQHAKYLNMGGVDGFIGDGRIKARAEHIVDIFYSVNLLSSLWVTADYQHITNPGFNADRGPVNVYGMRVHAEF